MEEKAFRSEDNKESSISRGLFGDAAKSTSDGKDTDWLFNFSTRPASTSSSLFFGLKKSPASDFWSSESKVGLKEVARVSQFYSGGSEQGRVNKTDSTQLSQKEETVMQSDVCGKSQKLVLKTETSARDSEFPYLKAATLASIMSDHSDQSNYLLADSR